MTYKKMKADSTANLGDNVELISTPTKIDSAYFMEERCPSRITRIILSDRNGIGL